MVLTLACWPLQAKAQPAAIDSKVFTYRPMDGPFPSLENYCAAENEKLGERQEGDAPYCVPKGFQSAKATGPIRELVVFTGGRGGDYGGAPGADCAIGIHTTSGWFVGGRVACERRERADAGSWPDYTGSVANLSAMPGPSSGTAQVTMRLDFSLNDRIERGVLVQVQEQLLVLCDVPASGPPLCIGPVPLSREEKLQGRRVGQEIQDVVSLKQSWSVSWRREGKRLRLAVSGKPKTPLPRGLVGLHDLTKAPE